MESDSDDEYWGSYDSGNFRPPLPSFTQGWALNLSAAFKRSPPIFMEVENGPIVKGNDRLWRYPFSTSMILGGRVKTLEVNLSISSKFPKFLVEKATTSGLLLAFCCWAHV